MTPNPVAIGKIKIKPAHKRAKHLGPITARRLKAMIRTHANLMAGR